MAAEKLRQLRHESALLRSSERRPEVLELERVCADRRLPAVGEVFSPPRFTEATDELGFASFGAFDLATEWDASNPTPSTQVVVVVVAQRGIQQI